MPLFAKQSGYFLVTVMIFIHVISFVSFHELSQLKNEMASIKKSWQINTDNHISEYVLAIVEKMLAKDKITCIISQQSSDQLRQRDLLWWQKNGCKVNHYADIYWYVVERVMYDACAVSTEAVNVKLGMTYYRISALRSKSQSILQSITAVNDDVTVCNESQHLRSQGRQSWREL